MERERERQREGEKKKIEGRDTERKKEIRECKDETTSK